MFSCLSIYLLTDIIIHLLHIYPNYSSFCAFLSFSFKKGLFLSVFLLWRKKGYSLERKKEFVCVVEWRGRRQWWLSPPPLPLQLPPSFSNISTWRKGFYVFFTDLIPYMSCTIHVQHQSWITVYGSRCRGDMALDSLFELKEKKTYSILLFLLPATAAPVL